MRWPALPPSLLPFSACFSTCLRNVRNGWNCRLCRHFNGQRGMKGGWMDWGEWCAGRAVPRRLDVVFECWPDVILYCEIYVSITALRQRNVSKMKVAIFQLNSLIVNEYPPIHNPLLSPSAVPGISNRGEELWMIWEMRNVLEMNSWFRANK